MPSLRGTSGRGTIFAVRVLLRKLSKCYPAQFELIPVLLLLLVFYLVLSVYGDLPDRIPVGFDIHGEPDDWAHKGMVLLFPGLAAFVYLLMTGLTAGLALVKDPLSMVNISRSRKAAVTGDQAERLRVLVARSLMMLKTLLLALMAYLGYATGEIAFERAENLGAPFFVIVAAILGTAAYMVWMIWRVTAPKSEREIVN